jgi:hypothetical protein
MGGEWEDREKVDVVTEESTGWMMFAFAAIVAISGDHEKCVKIGALVNDGHTVLYVRAGQATPGGSSLSCRCARLRGVERFGIVGISTLGAHFVEELGNTAIWRKVGMGHQPWDL